jgi:hypothetical protein
MKNKTINLIEPNIKFTYLKFCIAGYKKDLNINSIIAYEIIITTIIVNKLFNILKISIPILLTYGTI